MHSMISQKSDFLSSRLSPSSETSPRSRNSGSESRKILDKPEFAMQYPHGVQVVHAEVFVWCSEVYKYINKYIKVYKMYCFGAFTHKLSHIVPSSAGVG